MITNVRPGPQPFPDPRYMPPIPVQQRPTEEAPMRDPTTKLTKQEREKLLDTLHDWWLLAREAHVENRWEQRVDEDFYDHLQYTEEELYILKERNQAPLVYNKIFQAINWVLGSERRSRLEWNIYPRTDDDIEAAQAKKSVMKYIADTSRANLERSMQFEDCVKTGVGWIEEGVRNDLDEEPLFIRHERWDSFWWDPYSRRNDLDDCRFIFRAKWVDLDVAKAICEEKHHQALKDAAMARTFPDHEMPDSDFDLPSLFLKYDQWGQPQWKTRHSSMVNAPKDGRKRVRLVECWYRRPVKKQRIWGETRSGEEYDPSDPMMAAEVANGATLTDTITWETCVALFIEGTILKHAVRPYKHNRYPFTPCWAYRRGRDGMPYGLIRGIRDAQQDYNKRMSKALYILSARQVIYEDGAIEDIDEFAEHLADPAGTLRVRAGALQQKRIEILQNTDIASGHIDILGQDAAHIYDGTGVTPENMGKQTNARTGEAIQSRQQGGAMATAALFDNRRFALQISGEKMLSLIEQFMPAQRQIRVASDSKLSPYEFVTINEPILDEETGELRYRNDITAGKADFIVDAQDYSESVRIALAEHLMTMMGQLPPELSVQLLDLPIDLMDVPQKRDILKRIRRMIGVQDPDLPPDSPEAQEMAMEQQRQAEAQARQDSLAEAEQTAKIRGMTARTRRDEAAAQEALIRARETAVNTAAAEEYLNEGGSLESYLQEE